MRFENIDFKGELVYSSPKQGKLFLSKIANAIYILKLDTRGFGIYRSFFTKMNHLKVILLFLQLKITVIILITVNKVNCHI